MDKKEKRRNSARKWRYGITKEMFEAMVNERHGKCDICHKVPSGKRKTLQIDHDHKTNLIRGLLCNSCNMALGKFGDTPDMITSLVAYFNNPPVLDTKKEKDIRNDLLNWMMEYF